MSKMLKVVVLGDVSVGKTTLLKRYVNGMTGQLYKPTIGLDLFEKNVQVLDGTNVTVILWDTAGMERNSVLSPSFYRGADCCVLVFDVTKPSTFDNLQGWMTTFLKGSGVHDPINFPFVVLGNKIDLHEQQMDFKKVIEWCQEKRGLTYFHASAMKGTNVKNAFEKIVEYAYDYGNKSHSGCRDLGRTDSVLKLVPNPEKNTSFYKVFHCL